ncbi:hypothetical protein BDR03DRAFT_648333 [Suillus americanus]|nr:hypothetical protein BDR03DRAFT_648333 [Suillus americanus]
MVDLEIHNRLSLLALYLENLPDTIPLVHASATQYGFDFYAADDEDILDMGEIGALNWASKIRLGQRNNGPMTSSRSEVESHSYFYAERKSRQKIAGSMARHERNNFPRAYSFRYGFV